MRKRLFELEQTFRPYANMFIRTKDNTTLWYNKNNDTWEGGVYRLSDVAVHLSVVKTITYRMGAGYIVTLDWQNHIRQDYLKYSSPALYLKKGNAYMAYAEAEASNAVIINGLAIVW